MPIATLLSALDERTIARQIGIPHDEVRMRYSLPSNTVATFDAFSDVIGDYYAYHYGHCISLGGHLSRTEAVGRAKEILEKESRRQNGTIVSAFNDAQSGMNGGMRKILDAIAEAIKAEATERYIRDVFDRHVSPASWTEQVQIIADFIAQCGPYLASSIDVDTPERYARNYEELIRSYVQQLRNTSSMFRRL